MPLTLGPPNHARDDTTTLHDVIVAYAVLGLPPNESAQIHDFGGDQGWRIRRIKNGVAAEWEGS